VGILLGMLLFALCGILLAIRSYLNMGDKVVAGALIFAALLAIGIEGMTNKPALILLVKSRTPL
jgi:hypothetical protein